MKYKFLIFIIVVIAIGSVIVIAQNTSIQDDSTSFNIPNIDSTVDISVEDAKKDLTVISEGRKSILISDKGSGISFITILRGILGIIVLVLIAYVALVIYIFYQTMDETALFVGIPLAIVYAFVCFFIKRIRSKMTIWWGILSLLSAAWWIYLLTQ